MKLIGFVNAQKKSPEGPFQFRLRGPDALNLYARFLITFESVSKHALEFVWSNYQATEHSPNLMPFACRF